MHSENNPDPATGLPVDQSIQMEDSSGSGQVIMEHAPQFTTRAIITGMTLGAVLSLCNIYAGLKVGWGFNMSIVAALLSFGFWNSSQRFFGTREWGILENNIGQTTASGAASISSAGLVAGIPALTLLTGQHLTWVQLAAWTFCVCFLGVMVGAALRHQMLNRENLAFPSGIATAVTLQDLYDRGTGAGARMFALLASICFSSANFAVTHLWLHIKRFGPSISLPVWGNLKVMTLPWVSTSQLGFALEPSLLLIGTGALMSFRVALSLFGGAIIAWAILPPLMLGSGWVDVATLTGKTSWYGPLVRWLLWPGVGLMVCASLTSISFSWRSWIALFKGMKGGTKEPEDTLTTGKISRRELIIGFVLASLLAITLQSLLFGIAIWMGTLAVLLGFVLAAVAGRVSGETAITPKGALGKVSQLTFGLLAPGNVAPNLMAANMTAGAAAQSADLLHDLKTGQILGAAPKSQFYAQLFGILSGATMGSAAYLLLLPDPKKQLFTNEWPAPAVAVWKSVAELFRNGFGSMPPGAITALFVGSVVGIVLAILEKAGPEGLKRWLPSPAALGLAFVLPAYSSMTIFVGGSIAFIASKIAPEWADRMVVIIAAGLIAGESLTGAISSFVLWASR